MGSRPLFEWSVSLSQFKGHWRESVPVRVSFESKQSVKRYGCLHGRQVEILAILFGVGDDAIHEHSSSPLAGTGREHVQVSILAIRGVVNDGESLDRPVVF
jgi:hypothetical protein